MHRPVRLKYATSQAFTVGGVSDAYMYTKAKVSNIGFAKDVQIHFRTPSGTWIEQPLIWIANFGDYDLFLLNHGTHTAEFVIRYSVNGVTFWDNNQNVNYHLNNFANTVGGNVVLNRAVAKIGTQVGGGFVFTTSWLEGEIYVNNLSFGKQVGVRLSTDGGLSWQDTNASFVGNIGEGTFTTSLGAELWRFKTPELNLDPAATFFRFAIYYRNLATNEWFWDNNFEQDYRMSKVEGTFIE